MRPARAGSLKVELHALVVWCRCLAALFGGGAFELGEFGAQFFEFEFGFGALLGGFSLSPRAGLFAWREQKAFRQRIA